MLKKFEVIFMATMKNKEELKSFISQTKLTCHNWKVIIEKDENTLRRHKRTSLLYLLKARLTLEVLIQRNLGVRLKATFNLLQHPKKSIHRRSQLRKTLKKHGEKIEWKWATACVAKPPLYQALCVRNLKEQTMQSRQCCIVSVGKSSWAGFTELRCGKRNTVRSNCTQKSNAVPVCRWKAAWIVLIMKITRKLLPG